MRYFLCWLILGILVFTLITGCNHHSFPAKMPTAECRMVKHTMGETCVPLHPQRVLTLSSCTLGNVLALGVIPVGTTNEIYQEENFLTSIQKKAANIKLVGTSQPNLEAILLLKPDLIVGVDWFKPIYPLLAKIAPTILDKIDYPDWEAHFSLVAEVLGKQDDQKALWERYYQRIEKLKLALGNRYQGKKISFIYVWNSQISIDAKNSFAASILADALLQRPDSQNLDALYASFPISLEELKKVDGDVLFVANYAKNGEQFPEEIQRHPLWQNLKAVRENHVYYVDFSSWAATNMLGVDAVIDDLFKYLVNTP